MMIQTEVVRIQKPQEWPLLIITNRRWNLTLVQSCAHSLYCFNWRWQAALFEYNLSEIKKNTSQAKKHIQYHFIEDVTWPRRNFSSRVEKYFKSEHSERVRQFSTRERKFHLPKRPCNVLFITIMIMMIMTTAMMIVMMKGKESAHGATGLQGWSP